MFQASARKAEKELGDLQQKLEELLAATDAAKERASKLEQEVNALQKEMQVSLLKHVLPLPSWQHALVKNQPSCDDYPVACSSSMSSFVGRITIDPQISRIMTSVLLYLIAMITSICSTCKKCCVGEHVDDAIRHHVAKFHFCPECRMSTNRCVDCIVLK